MEKLHEIELDDELFQMLDSMPLNFLNGILETNIGTENYEGCAKIYELITNKQK